MRYHRWWMIAIRGLIGDWSHVLRLVLNGWVILLLLFLLLGWWRHVIQLMVDIVGLRHDMVVVAVGLIVVVVVMRLRYHALLAYSRLLLQLLWPGIYDNPCQ